jgi:regulator of cell morphogenesis and NO signaling
MKLFTSEDKLSRVVTDNYHLLPVINRFGIRLGFGDATIGEICAESGIHVPFFLVIINAFHHPDYFPKSEFLKFSPRLIVDYLRHTHQYYLSWVVPKMEKQLENLVESSEENTEDLKLIILFFRKYKSELLYHIKDEEDSVFPYVLRITAAHEDGVPISKEDWGKSIETYEKEHSDVDEKMTDLKNLVIKFLKADYNDNLCNDFLITLFRFERDLIDHARIEDKILVPMITRIENILKNDQ